MIGSSATIAITVDVEDWPQSSWDRSLSLGEYCADNTRRVLALFAEFPEARGTFFVLGRFAEKHPSVVREIVQAGHEVASHGYGHEEVFHLGREGFAEDLKRSDAVIAGAAGKRPVGYRAPDFSIVGESLWALDVLSEQGYSYDTSIFPVAKARYGIDGWPRDAVCVSLPNGRSILELPLGTVEVFGRRLPVGGGYARLLPAWALTRAMHAATRQLRLPPVFYCHPYEFDPDEFDRLKFDVPRKVRFHQGAGRKKTAGKIRRLLKNFRSVSLSQVIVQAGDLPMMDYGHYVLDPKDVVRPPIFEQMPHSHSD